MASWVTTIELLPTVTLFRSRCFSSNVELDWIGVMLHFDQSLQSGIARHRELHYLCRWSAQMSIHSSWNSYDIEIEIGFMIFCIDMLIYIKYVSLCF